MKTKNSSTKSNSPTTSPDSGAQVQSSKSLGAAQQKQEQAKPEAIEPERVVRFEGPEAEADPKGEKPERPVWHVWVETVTEVVVSRVYKTTTYAKGEALALAMAKDRGLELIHEAQQA